MALPPYFNKVALGATSLMQGVGHDTFRQRVEGLSITIAFGAHAVESPEGRRLLDLLTNLLARFFPRLRFLDQGATAVTEELMAAATQINPGMEFTDDPSAACFAVGEDASSDGAFTIFLGSDGWIAHLSTSSRRSLGRSENPFGAGAAACIGVAFVFRHFFADLLGVAGPAQTVSLSLATYDVRMNDDRFPAPTTLPAIDVDLGEIALVGAGAIGNGVVWALAGAPCSGTLHLIDHEAVDETNPQRYILTEASSRDLKVELAAKALAGSKLSAHPYHGTWAHFASAHGYVLPRLVACALDSAFDRCAVQASLPEFLLNAWTQRGDLGVSRHEFLGDSACLACLYWPRAQQKNLDQLVMEAIRYSGELMDVRNALYLHTRLEDAWLERIAEDMGVARERLEGFRGKTLDEFYREAICGGHVIATDHEPVEVPMAFQSALAGIMLAAEIVKCAAEPVLRDGIVTTKIDLLRPVGTRLSEQSKKPSSIRCICQDPLFVDRYRQKYPHRTTHAVSP